MLSFDTAVIVLAVIALFAAFVNGALGYGFSSLTVPVSLVFYANRVLNPAVVVIEVFINLYVLLINLNGVRAVWKRVIPILIGLLPGIAVGASVLVSLQPGWIKFGTYTVILPLILLQAAGWRRPIRSTWLVGLPFGSALGVLYSVTTLSGPPLAMLFNNQGLVRTDFRAGLALVRVAESSVTAFVYFQLGLFISESENILFVLIPSVVIGIPLGSYFIRRLNPETFRMGRRIRFLPSTDRSEVDAKPVGIQHHGSHHFNRYLFVVYVFHGTTGDLKAIARYEFC